MGYRGHVENGKIVLDDDVRLPDGARLDLRIVGPADPDEMVAPGSSPADEDSVQTIEDTLAEIAGQIPDDEWAKLPSDLSDQLDHHVYGTPKR